MGIKDFWFFFSTASQVNDKQIKNWLLWNWFTRFFFSRKNARETEWEVRKGGGSEKWQKGFTDNNQFFFFFLMREKLFSIFSIPSKGSKPQWELSSSKRKQIRRRGGNKRKKEKYGELLVTEKHNFFFFLVKLNLKNKTAKSKLLFCYQRMADSEKKRFSWGTVTISMSSLFYFFPPPTSLFFIFISGFSTAIDFFFF